ncbi:MAG: phosphoribosylformylglycinamidine synthase subunit PurL [Chloroflexota bacterium]
MGVSSYYETTITRTTAMNRYARLEIRPIPPDAGTAALCRAAHDLGFSTLEQLYHTRLFFIAHPALTDKDVDRLSATLLTDPVVEQSCWQWVEPGAPPPVEPQTVEVEFHPGVTDRVAYEIKKAAQRLGLPPLQVATGHQYRWAGRLDRAEQHRLARQVLCNEVVQRYQLGPIAPAFIEETVADSRVETFNLADLNDSDLLALSQTRRLALNLAEIAVLRAFSRQAARPLTDAELEMVAQTWSEHCFHKTFKAQITYREIDPATQQAVHQEIIDGLFKTYIRAATAACAKDWLVSAFVDNAGIVKFDGEYVLSFKVETHNHPSALEPFGGANTGVGGVIRDILGVSARPIAATDVLCFGPQDLPPAEVPAGSLHPRRVQAGVVAGVGDYGNKMGVPTVNGAVVYHPGYTANPLVYCGCVGLAPAGSHTTAPQPGDRLLVLGGRTGRDGLRGATFSSLDLDSETSEATFASTAVQIGDPIIEKDVAEVVLAARDARLYHAVTDCGAGGLSSAIGEMAQELGAAVELKRVGLKYSGLRPWEIWLSEAQERMVLAVPAGNLPQLAELCRRFEVDWDEVGYLSGDGRIVVRYDGQTVVDLPLDLLFNRHPRLELLAEWQPAPPLKRGGNGGDIDPTLALLALLADPNVASKEAVIRTYDHEVQGATVVKPLTGARNHGPSDAAVLKPRVGQTGQGIALSNGLNPFYSALDPYAMAVSAVDEAVRNAVAVGGDPDQLSLLDNFCWGNPNLPDRLGGLVRAAKGCYDAARAFDAPFISGKDSLNNEYVDSQGQRTPIPGTLLISAMAIVPDIQHVVTMDAKRAGDVIYIVGQTRRELGGSLLARHYDVAGDIPPTLPPRPLETARALHRAMRRGLVRACHDLSEGGLAVAAAEMALAGGLGLSIDLAQAPLVAAVGDPLLALFSESNGRWLVEVAPELAAAFEETLAGYVAARCGAVIAAPLLRVGPIEVEVSRLDAAWRGQG